MNSWIQTLLTERNIFLLDAIGAVVSATVTGLVLPMFSEWIGLPLSFLYFLAAFPLVYGIYSLSCYWFVKAIRPWMLLTIVIANLAYCLISGAVLLAFPGLTIWGGLFLTSEILIIFLVVALELKVYRKAFG